ncbi:MAG: hypothetical protein CSYNP_02101 [Syntrophus sp. SKADARSKE-3]|nr:hypothetical protein [Syntrophus sp. SKADARSKE-3]
MKKIIIPFLALLSLSVTHIMIADKALCYDAAQRKAFIATLPQGSTFENDGMTYVWLPTLRGEKKSASSGKTAESATGGRQTIEQKGGFTIYKPAASGTMASQAASRNTATAHRIALNVQTQSLAVVTGKLWLKLKDINDARPIADEYGLTFSHIFAPMMTAFYQAPDGADLEALRKKLLADDRIKRVTLDMVDRIRQPH